MSLVEKILSLMPLFCGVCAFVSGAVMIWHLPSYKRKVETGEIKRSPSRPSFRTLWIGAIGSVILGILSFIYWYWFNPISK
jgi:hypothetical protein